MAVVSLQYRAENAPSVPWALSLQLYSKQLNETAAKRKMKCRQIFAQVVERMKYISDSPSPQLFKTTTKTAATSAHNNNLDSLAFEKEKIFFDKIYIFDCS